MNPRIAPVITARVVNSSMLVSGAIKGSTLGVVGEAMVIGRNYYDMKR